MSQEPKNNEEGFMYKLARAAEKRQLSQAQNPTK